MLSFFYAPVILPEFYLDKIVFRPTFADLLINYNDGAVTYGNALKIKEV